MAGYTIILRSQEFGAEDFHAENEEELRSKINSLVDGIIECSDDVTRHIVIQPHR